MKSAPWIIIGGLIAWFLLRKARTISSLQFVPLDISLSGGSLNLVIGVQNPTSNPLTLRSLIGGLYVDGQRVARISDFTTQIVQPNAETPVMINVAPDLFGLVSGVVNAIKNGLPTTNHMQLQATANIDNQPFAVKTDFT